MINLTKQRVAERYLEEYSKLSDTDKNLFSKVCNDLLSENFIYGQKGHDEITYRNINRFRILIELYFALIDFELIHDDNYKIYYLRSRLVGTRAKLKKLETVILLILAKLYMSKSLDVSLYGSVEVTVLIEDLINEINKTRIFTRTLYKTDLSNALKTLKRYKIIDISNTDISNVEAFNILPTILYIVKDNDLVNIENKLTALNTRSEESEDEINETNED